MKKLIALLLAAVLVVSLAACGKNGGPTDPTTGSGSSQNTESTTPPATGPLYDTESYSVSDADAVAAKDAVVATVGDRELTNSALQIMYWMEVYDFFSNYSGYFDFIGFDHNLPLDEQENMNGDGTWQHFFLDSALSKWHSYQAMAILAEEADLDMLDYLQNEIDNLEKELSETATENKFDSIDALIQADMGPGTDFEAYLDYTEVCYWGYTYYEHMYDQLEVTDAMIEEYFEEHKVELSEEKITKESGDVVAVRHILIEIEGGTKDDNGNVTYSDDDWEACRVKAQKLLDEWLDGEATEDAFADLAYEHSADGGSYSNGGLYEGLNDETNFVPEFKEWYLDESRQVGDYGLIKTDYGYHIMYYSSVEPEWINHCRNAILTELGDKIYSDSTEKYPLTVNYDNIALGVVDLTQ